MSNLAVALLYSLAIVLFVLYFYIKYKTNKYIFSFYTITIFIFAFTLFIIGPLQYNLKAWNALGIFEIGKVVEFYPYINKVYILNLIGFCIYILALIYFEFKNKKNKIYDIVENKSLRINYSVLKVLFFSAIIMWYGITISINKTLPILNNNRLFIEDYGLLRPIYLGLNSIIELCTIIFIIKFITKRNKAEIINIFIGIFTLLATGNRGPLISIVTTSFIYIVYLFIKDKKNIVIAILISLLLCGALGMGLEIIRGSSVGDNIINSIAYGNTFSDIRDGAFVLQKYEESYDGYLLGKNYIADMISFIPSSISEYRQTWSYGSFTTKTLFGWDNHYGLRGGWFLEGYMNFSVFGIVIVAVLYAYYTAGVEKFFKNNIVENQNIDNITNGILIISVLGIIFSSLATSSGFNTIYANTAFLIANISISKIIIIFKGRKNV